MIENIYIYENKQFVYVNKCKIEQRRENQVIFVAFLFFTLFRSKEWSPIQLSTHKILSIKLNLINICAGSVDNVRRDAMLPMAIQLHRTAVDRCFAHEPVPLHPVRYRNMCFLYFV